MVDTQPALQTPPVSSHTDTVETLDSAATWKYPDYPASDLYTPGVAPIRKEFRLPHRNRRGANQDSADREAQALPDPDDDAAESRTGPSLDAASTVRPAPELADAAPSENQQDDGNPSSPAVKLKGAARKRARKAEARANKKQKQSGQNKNRQFAKTKDTYGMCDGFLATGKCTFEGQCRFSHDLMAYLADKAKDIYRPPPPRRALHNKEAWLLAQYSTERIQMSDDDDDDDWTHVRPVADRAEAARSEYVDFDPAVSSLDENTSCPIFSVKGFCDFGWKCRFLGAHVHVVGPSKSFLGNNREGSGFAGTGLVLVRDEDRARMWGYRSRKILTWGKAEPVGKRDREEINYVTTVAMKALKSRTYPLGRTKAVLDYLERESRELSRTDPSGSQAGSGPIPIVFDDADKAIVVHGAPLLAKDEDAIEEMENAMRNQAPGSGTEQRQAEAAVSAVQGDIDTARIRPSEKRRLNWRGELYLAPLTTTGNLPFRRICSSYGSDIHCGEMGLAESFLRGNASEWSLVRRWEGERIFGTQLCGGKPNLLVPVAEALKKEVGDGLDFVDINCGCPIDLVYNRGAGSALLDKPTQLSKIVRGMNAVLGETPLTIKLRTGTSAKQTTHKLFARLQTEWGVSAATMHGRSRKQRYKNFADWGYIKTCADTLRESVRTWNEEQEGADAEEMVPIPIYGNGDVYSWQDYYERLERTGVDGEMVARGALIKPWLFTEIKERRDWDISSRERLDIIRQFSSYGLCHWGSDTQGVNTTRRFLCEMLSFTHRYVPTGILEHLPARMNDRPPPFKGRDELETLLASGNSEDWVRISEMFLGKAPEEWSFTPKHKSSSYADAGDEQQG